LYKILVIKPEEKRPRDKWDIKINLGDIRLDGVDWVYLAKDRDQWCTLVNMVIFWFPKGKESPD
jgi:hypothetical protein